MGKYETILFIGLIVIYPPPFGLYHLMVFRVNRRLPPDRRIPHRLTPRWDGRLGTVYKAFYPRSHLYGLTLLLLLGILIIAPAFVGLRIWEQATGRWDVRTAEPSPARYGRNKIFPKKSRLSIFCWAARASFNGKTESMTARSLRSPINLRTCISSPLPPM